MALGTFKNFGNNLFIDKFDYRFAGKFTDENRILNMLNGDEASKRVHLGMLSLFNQMQLINTPLIKETELAGNEIMLNGDDGEFTFDVPYTLEMPSIKADLTGSTQVGVDGQTFEVVIGDGNLDPIFSETEIIACDLRDGQNFEVVYVGERYGEGFLYKLRLVTNDKTESVDKRQLAPGTQYFSLGTATGKYDERGAGINQSAGKMRFLHRMGGKRMVQATIHGSAQRLKLDGVAGMDGKIANDFAATVAPYLDPKNPQFLQAIGYNNGKGQIDYTKPVSVIAMWEILLYKQLMLNRQMALTWGQGGTLQDQRNTTKIVAQGLYQQMKNGNWLQVSRYTKDTIISILSQVFKNRPDIEDVDRYIHFQGGRGAVIELTRIFTQEAQNIANSLGTVLNNASIGGGVIQGPDPYHLKAGFRFNQIFFPGFGHVTIEHNIAFDANWNRYMDEEYIGGLPKYSYTCAVFDLTKTESTNAFKPSSSVTFAKGFDNSANVYMLKNAGMPGIKTTYLNGRTSPYPIQMGKGQVISSLFDGCTITMEEQSEVWLKDPGRSVLLQLK